MEATHTENQDFAKFVTELNRHIKEEFPDEVIDTEEDDAYIEMTGQALLAFARGDTPMFPYSFSNSLMQPDTLENGLI